MAESPGAVGTAEELVPLGLRSQGEADPTDTAGRDLHKRVLECLYPGRQRQVHDGVNLSLRFQNPCGALEDNAPRLILGEAVNLEGHGVIDGQLCQLGSGVGPDQQFPLMGQVVDGEDVRLVGNAQRQPAEARILQKTPSLIDGCVFAGVLISSHAVIMPHKALNGHQSAHRKS